MRYCDWDEVLDRDGLLILTEEALTTPRRSRAPLRRLAAAAACAASATGPSEPGTTGTPLCRISVRAAALLPI